MIDRSDFVLFELIVSLCVSLFGGAACSNTVGSQGYQAIVDHAVAQGVPGIQAYVKRGADRWVGTAGVSSVEAARPMELTDRLRVASITKMMTYAAILELVKAGRLRLSDRAVTVTQPGILEGIPYADEITVAHLLEHRSGLYNFNGEDGADFFRDLFSDPQRGSRSWTTNDLLAYAKRREHPPSDRPGVRMAYSSTGYIVLQAILEHVTGRPFAEVYRELLFDPLGMTSAGVEGADLGTDSIASSYARPDVGDRAGPSPFAGRKAVRKDGLVNLSAGLAQYNGWARGAGAVAVSVQDLARFMDAVKAGRVTVLADQTKEFARAKLKTSFFDWNGGSWGIQATILFEPFRDITIIVLTNSSNTGRSSHDIARDLLNTAREAVGRRDPGAADRASP